jgi:hypothetical protein
VVLLLHCPCSKAIVGSWLQGISIAHCAGITLQSALRQGGCFFEYCCTQDDMSRSRQVLGVARFDSIQTAVTTNHVYLSYKYV